MSATMTAPEQIDGLEKLIALASLRKEDIIATQTEARKQLQLTQEEQGKVAEAKTYIAKHASLAADLQGREDVLAEAKKQHEKAVADHAAHVAFENARLEDFSASLTSKLTEIEKREKRIPEAEGSLHAAVAEHERQNNEAISKNIADAAANARDKFTNEAEAERLKGVEVGLKLKAQKIREQAANF